MIKEDILGLGDNNGAGARNPLERIKCAAAARGWRCLSDTWVGYTARYALECEQGHHFKRSGNYLLYGEPACMTCPECRAAGRPSI